MTVYKKRFALDKPYYQECFEQSVAPLAFHQAYLKAAILLILGGALVLFSEINQYAAWFIFSLGVVEAIAQYYRKPWWVMRQMLSRAAKGDVDLTIDEVNIHTKSFYHEQTIAWNAIIGLTETSKGWIIIHNEGRTYISKQHLNDDINKRLIQKSAESRF